MVHSLAEMAEAEKDKTTLFLLQTLGCILVILKAYLTHEAAREAAVCNVKETKEPEEAPEGVPDVNYTVHSGRLPVNPWT